MTLLYRLLINLILVFSPLILLFRIIKKKEDKIRFKEKFCFFSKKRGKGKLIWIHVASVGELLSTFPLIERLEKKKNIDSILVTSTTVSSSKIFDQYKFKKTVHQFFPIDSDFLTKRFLSYWKPSLAIFIESEIWPNMLANLRKRNISHILLNARITKKTFKRWKYLSSFSQIIFKGFSATYPQNIETFNFLKKLGATKIKRIGNLKFSEIEITKKNQLNKNVIEFFKNKKIWCASSTHEGEEILSANVHKKLKKKYKNLVTIIIPRHVHRTKTLVKSIKDLDLRTHCHSDKVDIATDTEVYMVDTYGETKLFFNISETVFLGGSLVKHGGQNPLEPARLGCNIIHGPHVNNFKEVYHLLDNKKMSHKVLSINQMTIVINQLFKQKKSSQLIMDKIKKLGNDVLNKTEKELNYFINTNEI
ncbi:3-deoxy-D-manno-octulosonic acid transferase [Candidatus Pelagibacter sp.]|nr:3-deoxy-D-manno-octulosonic acid transferase [Candidatus Pelagibacter sp.]